MSMRSSGLGLLVAALVGTTVVTLPGQPRAAASGGEAVNQDRVVSSTPASWTPQIKNGEVWAIQQVGTSMVVGGNFTQVSPASGSPISTRQNVVAFNATTGAITANFNPTINGQVNALLPGPTSSTVYVAGSFSTVNGQTGKVFLLDVTNGSIVSTFRPAGINGAVTDIAKSGNRLYVAGNFTSVGNQPHAGIATLNASTGAVDSFMSLDVSGHHNFNGSGASAPVGVRRIDISSDGHWLAAVGNFKQVEGLDRDQVVMIDLSGGNAVVRSDWRTQRYEARCFDWAFDSYIRDVDFAPDGSYFVIVATGGPNPGTLCDTAARWPTADTGQDVQPTWISDTGGDTLWSVEVTSQAVYSGGHQRWMNNTGGLDSPAPGAVPRPGLGALDVTSGVPLSWNPGRNPRGAGAYVLQATAAGLWVGMDTDYIGNFTYWRPKLAFFPLAGGTVVPPGDTRDLPANVYLGGTGSTSNVLYRVNAGGPQVAATDGGPDWADDSGADSPFRNSGSNGGGWSPVPNVDDTVPLSTPSAIFDSERWDPGLAGDPDGDEMHWHFPVASGEKVEVRLYFANRCDCTSAEGSRVFDVDIEDVSRLASYDIVDSVGDQTGTMRSWTVTSDGSVDIDFSHEIENPLISGIEIVKPSDVLHRINGGGTAIPAIDGGPGWVSDQASDSRVRNSGSSSADWSPVPNVDNTVPSSTPAAVFDSERWDPGDGDEMHWHLPVANGQQVQVRLYFANRYSGTGQRGQRVFNVDVEDVRRLSNFDIVAAAGDQTGTMRSWTVTSDGTINIDLGHVVENPLVNAIEIVKAGGGAPPPADDSLFRRWYDGSSATATDAAPAGGIQWSAVRGATVIDGVLFYALSNGTFHRRTFDGTTYGPDSVIDPYNDPTWSNVSTGSGQTYRGVKPDFYSRISSMTGMAFRDGKLYTTYAGSTTVEWRWFSPESGIISGEHFTVPGSFPDAGGLFFSNDFLYIAGRTSGNLSRVAWAAGAPSGSPTVVSGPSVDGRSWAAGALFVAAGPPPGGNQKPTAAFTSTCGVLSCSSLDGSSSSDDGTIVSYDWDFGDNQHGSGVTTSHSYPAAGDYDVTLTVTDNFGATASVTHTVHVTAPASAISFQGQAGSTVNGVAASVTVPSGTQAGDALLLFVSVNDLARTVSSPSGAAWTNVRRQESVSTATTLYSKIATAGVAGSTITVTADASTRLHLQLLTYRGTAGNPVEAVGSAADASTTQHVTPVVAVAGPGRWALSYWQDKSSSTTNWTPPVGVTQRAELIGSGSGRLTSLAADSGGPVGGSSYGGLTATTDQQSSRGTTFTVVLAPAP